MNTANEFPATILSVEVSVLSHKNVVASEASNSRLVDFKNAKFDMKLWRYVNAM